MNDLTDTNNPYMPSTEQSSEPVVKKRLAFLVGARNGFLWSLLVAVPTCYVFYTETCVVLANPIDLRTLVRTKIPLTNELRITSCVAAFVEVTRYIVLPWSLVAGVVKHQTANRKKKNLVVQGTEHADA